MIVWNLHHQADHGHCSERVGIGERRDKRDDPMWDAPPGKHEYQHEHVAVKRDGRVEIVRDVLDLKAQRQILGGASQVQQRTGDGQGCGGGDDGVADIEHDDRQAGAWPHEGLHHRQAKRADVQSRRVEHLISTVAWLVAARSEIHDEQRNQAGK